MKACAALQLDPSLPSITNISKQELRQRSFQCALSSFSSSPNNSSLIPSLLDSPSHPSLYLSDSRNDVVRSIARGRHNRLPINSPSPSIVCPFCKVPATSSSVRHVLFYCPSAHVSNLRGQFRSRISNFVAAATSSFPIPPAQPMQGAHVSDTDPLPSPLPTLYRLMLGTCPPSLHASFRPRLLLASSLFLRSCSFTVPPSQ